MINFNNIKPFEIFKQLNSEKQKLIREVNEYMHQAVSNHSSDASSIVKIIEQGATLKQAKGRVFILVRVPADLKVILLKGEMLKITKDVHRYLEGTPVQFKWIFIKNWSFKGRNENIVGLFKPVNALYSLHIRRKIRLFLIPFRETAKNLQLRENEVLVSPLLMSPKRLVLFELQKFRNTKWWSIETRSLGQQSNLFQIPDKEDLHKTRIASSDGPPIWNLALCQHSLKFDVDFPGQPSRLRFIKQ